MTAAVAAADAATTAADADAAAADAVAAADAAVPIIGNSLCSVIPNCQYHSTLGSRHAFGIYLKNNYNENL